MRAIPRRARRSCFRAALLLLTGGRTASRARSSFREGKVRRRSSLSQNVLKPCGGEERFDRRSGVRRRSSGECRTARRIGCAIARAPPLRTPAGFTRPAVADGAHFGQRAWSALKPKPVPPACRSIEKKTRGSHLSTTPSGGFPSCSDFESATKPFLGCSAHSCSVLPRRRDPTTKNSGRCR